MDEVDREYRGTGAAGALAFAGQGDLITDQDAIWTDLKPGAALQTWAKQEAYDELQEAKGDVHATDAKAFFNGTSAVFLNYVDEETMAVLHWDQVEHWKKDRWAVFIGANLKDRAAE
jgi:hypothetical protein